MVKTKKITNHFEVSPIIKDAPVEKKPGTDKNKGGETPPLQKDLPDGWVWKTVGNFCQIIRGVSYKKDQAREDPAFGHLPILRATNIQDNNLRLNSDLVYVPSSLVSDSQKLRPGDIVIATSSGSKHLVGKAAQVRKSWLGSFGVFCAVIRPNTEIEHRYLGYYFNSPFYKNFISSKTIGVNINNLRRGDLEEIDVPVAPPDQQQLIVAEIEKQFSRLDEAVAALKRIHANLKRYKASVLKAAVEGKLTEEWRKKNPDVEPASELLKRILAARKKKWEEKNLGKKYKEPANPESSALPELPKGWVWATIEQINNAPRLCAYGVLQPGHDVAEGVPLVRVEILMMDALKSLI